MFRVKLLLQIFIKRDFQRQGKFLFYEKHFYKIFFCLLIFYFGKYSFNQPCRIKYKTIRFFRGFFLGWVIERFAFPSTWAGGKGDESRLDRLLDLFTPPDRISIDDR